MSKETVKKTAATKAAAPKLNKRQLLKKELEEKLEKLDKPDMPEPPTIY